MNQSWRKHRCCVETTWTGSQMLLMEITTGGQQTKTSSTYLAIRLAKKSDVQSNTSKIITQYVAICSFLVVTSVQETEMSFPVQRRTKQKVVTDFATVNKGASAGAKPRAALRQVLFSQGVSEKNPVPEVWPCLIALNADVETDTHLLQVSTMSTTHQDHSLWCFKCVRIWPLFHVSFFLFVLLVFIRRVGARSTGFVKAWVGDVRHAGQHELGVGGGKSGDDAGEELDRNRGLSCGTSPSGNVVYFNMSWNKMTKYLIDLYQWNRMDGNFKGIWINVALMCSSL